MSSFTIKVLFTSVAFVLVSSCSSGSTDVASTDAPINTSAQEPSILADSLSSDVFKGTWVTECQPIDTVASIFVQYSFIFDGSEAAQLERTFDDSLCEKMIGYSYRVGQVRFNGTLVEANFGASVTAIEFHSIVDDDGASVEPLSNIVYRTENQLFFGDIDVVTGDLISPVALNYARPFVLKGVADIAMLDSLALSYAIEVVVERIGIRDSSTPNVQERAVVTTALAIRAIVSIAGNQDFDIALSPFGDFWVGQFQANEKTTATIAVTWSSSIDDGQFIILGDSQKTIAVTPNQIEVKFNSADYYLGHDADGDGVTNFIELEQGTDPLDPFSL